jgi:hypothetical protein
VQNTSVARKLHRQAASPKDSQHWLVLRQHISLKVCQARILSDPHEMPQDARRDAETPIVTPGQERDLGSP